MRARESLNGRKNIARRKVKNEEKSPWGQCLTDQFQTVAAVLASDWCQKNINREKTIFDVLYSKQTFLNNKISVSKNPKISIYPKGLVHGFGQKLEIF